MFGAATLRSSYEALRRRAGARNFMAVAHSDKRVANAIVLVVAPTLFCLSCVVTSPWTDFALEIELKVWSNVSDRLFIAESALHHFLRHLRTNMLL